jgi:hypothetical protein
MRSRSSRGRRSRRRPRPTKRPIHLLVHAQRRALERYELDLELAELVDVGRRIRSGDAILVDRQSSTRALYRVEVRARAAYVVWHRKIGAVATFLTADQIIRRYPELEDDLRILEAAA